MVGGGAKIAKYVKKERTMVGDYGIAWRTIKHDMGR